MLLTAEPAFQHLSFFWIDIFLFSPVWQNIHLPASSYILRLQDKHILLCFLPLNAFWLLISESYTPSFLFAFFHYFLKINEKFLRIFESCGSQQCGHTGIFVWLLEYLGLTIFLLRWSTWCLYWQHQELILIKMTKLTDLSPNE